MRVAQRELVNKRIAGYDVARTVAIFGMVIVNFKLVMGADAGGPPWLRWLLGLLEGRAAATFVVLAGIGISLASKRALESGEASAINGVRVALARRAVCLFAGGLLFATVWPADILHFYGLYIAIAALLVAAPTSRLWLSAVGVMGGFVVLFVLFDYGKGWDWQTLHYADFWTLRGMTRHLLFNGFHPVVPWVGFVIIGMVIGRLEMTEPSVRRRVFICGFVAALVAELVGWWMVSTLSRGREPPELEAISFVFGTGPMPPLPLYMVAGAGTAAAVIAACVALGSRYHKAAWLQPLVSAGQLALTLYVAHVVVGLGVLVALDRLENQTLVFALFAASLFCAASVICATWWRKRFARGPLERLLRAAAGSERRGE